MMFKKNQEDHPEGPVQFTGGKCHVRTMMHIHLKGDKTFKMNTHHVPFRQSVEEIRLEKD